MTDRTCFDALYEAKMYWFLTVRKCDRHVHVKVHQAMTAERHLRMSARNLLVSSCYWQYINYHQDSYFLSMLWFADFSNESENVKYLIARVESVVSHNLITERDRLLRVCHSLLMPFDCINIFCVSDGRSLVSHKDTSFKHAFIYAFGSTFL